MKKILITGGSSFLGHHVLKHFNKQEISQPFISPGAKCGGKRISKQYHILTPSSSELNLLDLENVKDYIFKEKPEIILHMAAKCGGIGANKNNPAYFLHENLRMASNLFEAIKLMYEKYKVMSLVGGKDYALCPIKYFYGLGSVCSYPSETPVPFREEDFWGSFPESTNAQYGYAKRILALYQQSFRKQFGLKGSFLVPVNMMGEYDHFSLDNSHVIPALIRKTIEAKKNNLPAVEVWGDGTPTREFLYAGDCADAIYNAINKKLDYDGPINIGTGKDISIKDLAFLIKELVGYRGMIKFNGETSVNGQMKRRLDVSLAKELFGFEAKTTLEEALKKTIDWYIDKNERDTIKTVDNSSDYCKYEKELFKETCDAKRFVNRKKEDCMKEEKTEKECYSGYQNVCLDFNTTGIKDINYTISPEITEFVECELKLDDGYLPSLKTIPNKTEISDITAIVKMLKNQLILKEKYKKSILDYASIKQDKEYLDNLISKSNELSNKFGKNKKCIELDELKEPITIDELTSIGYLEEEACKIIESFITKEFANKYKQEKNPSKKEEIIEEYKNALDMIGVKNYEKSLRGKRGELATLDFTINDSNKNNITDVQAMFEYLQLQKEEEKYNNSLIGKAKRLLESFKETVEEEVFHKSEKEAAVKEKILQSLEAVKQRKAKEEMGRNGFSDEDLLEIENALEKMDSSGHFK